jgi:lactoylglutathione lyase
MRLHHLGITVSDLDQSIRFYTSLFGFRLVEQGVHEGAPIAFITLGDGLVELVEGAPRPTEHHLALQVADLAAEVSRLNAAGVTLLDRTPTQAFNGWWIAFVAGPDGEWIELVEQ